MIKVENVDAWGFETAIRAMRNPMNSWDKSDSVFCHDEGCGVCEYGDKCSPAGWEDPEYMFFIGHNDADLMKRLFKSGVEHRTYARMIQVSMDITAPLYWWKEMDRYTVGKSQVSTSTMHKIHAKEFTEEDFSSEHLIGGAMGLHRKVINQLNRDRKKYLDTNNKQYWWNMIQLLPSSYNQRRTVMMSYETIFKIIRERKNHKLDEWREFVGILEQLPYVAEIMEGA